MYGKAGNSTNPQAKHYPGDSRREASFPRLSLANAEADPVAICKAPALQEYKI